VDLNLTDSQSMLRKTAREFLRAECPPALVKEMEENPKGYPTALWQRMADMGWLGVVVPGAYGGQEGTFLDLLVLLQEMGRAALPGPFFSTVVLGGLGLLEGGSEEQKRSLLPKLCNGTLLMTLALSEPGVDFDLDQIDTRAVKQNGHYAVRGTKLFVPDAHVADRILCVTVTETPGVEGREISVFLVDAGSSGIGLAPLETNLRDKQFEVSFEDVRVSEGDAVGGIGGGRKCLERALAKASVAKCAEMVGAGQRLLEMTVEYAKTRVQFGKPLGSFQAIQHHCANLATCVETAELITHYAGWLIEEGRPCAKEIAEAKAWTNEAGTRAAALAHQVHGGMAFTREYDLYLYSGRINAFAYACGDTRWCYEKVAAELDL
jgi:alkylation response protein AidB-like acyl-CoA dehydrogenase